ncbi:MAG: hypothetical protein MZV49_26400 [Rhodopseudomonas palustris]|nr:hypothetical protein [Rhodopseudomonas palustris]
MPEPPPPSGRGAACCAQFHNPLIYVLLGGRA